MKRNYAGRFKQRKGYSKQSLPKQVAWLTKQQKKSRGTELAERNYVQYGIGAAVDATGTGIHMTNISVGTGLGSRKDLKIKLSTLEYRYILTAADTVNTMRVLVVQSKAAISGPGTGDYIRLSSGGTGVGFAEPANVENCFVLADHIVHAGDMQGSCEGKITKFPIPTLQYTSTTGSTPSVGAIYVLIYSDSQVATHPSVNGWGKLKYFD